MKRNEKIEIRVSMEEKARLSELAQQEGESVSGLIRGLVAKYVSLNSPGTTRRLPKWQLAGLLVLAALIGHGLTLIPIHLHEINHQRAETPQPIYYVHGTIDSASFGMRVHADDPTKELFLYEQDDRTVTVRLDFKTVSEDTGRLTVSVCETVPAAPCSPIYENKMTIQRVAPSVSNGLTETGKPVHIVVQEMA